MFETLRFMKAGELISSRLDWLLVEANVLLGGESGMIFTRRSTPSSSTSNPEQAEASPSQIAAKAETVDSGMGPSIEDMREKLRSKLMMATFGEIVSLMVKSPAHKHYSLLDLEWLVIPPLLGNQFLLAEARLKNRPASVPMGGVFWARVSPAVDARLSSEIGDVLRLHPSEWKSGDIYWLISLFGDKRAAGGLISRLRETVFKDQPFKVIGTGEDGRLQVATIVPGGKPNPARARKSH
jgi:cytolysin-activating lysine-acyltransferase